MSRTPSYNIKRLPLWVQQSLRAVQDRADALQLENERLIENVTLLEEVNAELARELAALQNEANHG